MNREIKFRAWLYDEKQMIFSNDQASTDSCEVWIFYEGGLKVQTQETIWREQGGETIERIEYVDCQHSIMQFTGLTDKNGKEIFEGDIVRCKMPYGENFIVTWDEKRCAFYLKGLTKQDFAAYDKGYKMNAGKKEVYANIYDNPELLK